MSRTGPWRARAAVLVVVAVLASSLVSLAVQGAGTRTAAAAPVPNQVAFDYFIGQGLSEVQAAGIVGNLDQESGMDPGAVQVGGPGRGIAQWSVGGRWDTDADDNVLWYASTQNASSGTLGLQLAFVWYELTTFPYYGLSALQQTTDVSDATITFETDFEGCSECDQSARITYAQEALTAYGTFPATPTGLAVVGSGPTSVALSWNPSAAATSYTLTRQAGAATYTTPSITATSFTDLGTDGQAGTRDGGLIPGGTYGYTVTATNADGSRSSVQLIVTLPVDPSLLVSSQQLAAGGGAVSYLVYAPQSTGFSLSVTPSSGVSDTTTGPYTITFPPNTTRSTETYTVTTSNHYATGAPVTADETVTVAPAPVQAFFVDADRGDTLAYWSWSATAGWQQTFLGGDAVATGSSPSAVVVDGAPQVFFVDADRGDTLSSWSWTTTSGWQQTFLGGDAVTADSSPSAVAVGTSAQVFFADAGPGNTVSQWSWSATAGWHQTFLHGDQLAAGSGPSAVAVGTSAQVFFADAGHGDSVTQWSWSNSSGWQQTYLDGDAVSLGTSPSAVTVGSSAQVYFADATQGDRVSQWSAAGSSGWQETPFYGDTLTPGSSPSAVGTGGGAQVYFADAGHGNSVAEWAWNATTGWQQSFFSGDQITRGSSPDALVVGTTVQVYFADAGHGDTVTKWYTDPSTGPHQDYLFADRLAAGSSPSASV